MKEAFVRFVDYFIHPQLKVDRSDHERSIIYVLAFIIIFFMGVFYTAFYLTKGVFWDQKSFHNYLGIAVGLIGPIIIKRTGRTALALAIGAIMGGYLITASVYLSGGITSNDVLWYAVLAAASFMFIGTRIGIIISFLSIISLTAFYVLDAYYRVKFNADTISLSIEYRYFNLVLVLGVLSFMVFILVTGNIKLQKVIQLGKEQKVREEIARDFHDQIGNKLASLMHLSELMKIKKSDGEKEQLAAKIDLNAKYVYDNFRDFIWTLDAKSDQLPEIFMYLRDFAEDYFKFSEIKLFITSFPDQLPDIILPSYYSKEIMPMFKEAVTNVYKHSRAKNVHLNFFVTQDKLTIVLKDDGLGMDDSTLKRGNGLTNMMHRAERTGGILSFETSPLKGTQITYSVLLPVRNRI